MPAYSYVPMFFTLLIFGGGWVTRIWLNKFIEKLVDARFDRRMETFRSDLRTKETQIAALQSAVLNNRAGRDTLIEKRKLEAAESLWSSTLAFRSFKMAAITLNIFELDKLGKQAEHDERMRSMVGKVANVDDDSMKALGAIGGDKDRLFVSIDAWATFNALRAILIYAHARLLAIKNGLKDSEKLIHGDHVLKVAKAALPGHSAYIDKHKFAGIGHLIDPLEDLLFQQLQQSIEGVEADAQSVLRSTEVLRLVNEAKLETTNEVS